jgi:soluble lytic murein transglycosylase
MRRLRPWRPLRYRAILWAVKQAIDLMREGKTGEATGIKKSIDDPVARKIVEWLILRHPSGDAGFGRYAAFIADNPSWPGIALLRRRAEGRLWQERSEAATVRRFTGGQPASAKGRFALASAPGHDLALLKRRSDR